MLNRIFKLIVTLTLLLFLVQAVIGLLARVLETVPGPVSMLGSAGGFLVQLLVGAVVLSFVVGLLVRFGHWMRSKNSRHRPGQGQGSREWGGRDFADEVPVDRSGAHRSRSRPRQRS